MMDMIDIAKKFSLGAFSDVMDQIHPQCIWDIIGTKRLNNKKEIIAYTTQVAQYFKQASPTFSIHDSIADAHQVVISGNAFFHPSDGSIKHIQSCDIYNFDAHGCITFIKSYCIEIK